MTDVNTTAEVSDQQEPGEAVVAPAPKPGEKTDPALLLKSLKEERERIKILEAELAAKPSVPDSNGGISASEAEQLRSKLSELEVKVTTKEEKDRLNAVESTYPAIKDKSQEFTDFRNLPENAGMRLETAAKAFLVENDLLEGPEQRRGLERASGGVREAPKQGRSPEEIDELRNNNYRQYVKELKAGTL